MAVPLHASKLLSPFGALEAELAMAGPKKGALGVYTAFALQSDKCFRLARLIIGNHGATSTGFVDQCYQGFKLVEKAGCVAFCQWPTEVVRPSRGSGSTAESLVHVLLDLRKHV